MKRSTILGTVAVVSSLGMMTPLLAAETAAATRAASPAGNQATAAKPAAACMSDVRAFTTKMSKQGYWVGGSDFGYGYPMGGNGFGYGYGIMTGGRTAGATGGYTTARPGVEIRTLVTSANILAKAGKKQACESVLAEARTIFTRNAADLHDRGISWGDQPDWHEKAIAAAKPVTDKDVSFRYDQLLDNDVVNPGNQTLGSVHDLVTDPQTGKIAYVVISRGGLFGIDASYTPVPWNDFKATANGGLLVLDTTKALLAAAPQARDDEFTKAGQFDAESQKVGAYWAVHIKPASD